MEGLILKAYIENQRRPKTQIAKELGMSKQNLYQLFDSNKLEAGTIKKIEALFRTTWTAIRTSVNIDGNITVKNNAPVRPQEAQHAPDYRDEVILLLKEKISLNESRMLLLIQRNHALLNAVVETLPKLVAKLERIKLLEAHEEMNKLIHPS